MLDALKALFRSRKFLLMLLDAAISLSLLFFGDFPNVGEIIGIMQPVFVAVIAGIALEDAAEKRNGS